MQKICETKYWNFFVYISRNYSIFIGGILMELTKLIKICKMEQCLNYTLMMKIHDILETLIIFLSQLKTLMKSFTLKRQTPKTAIAEPFSKISNEKKISNKQFHHCEGKLF